MVQLKCLSYAGFDLLIASVTDQWFNKESTANITQNYCLYLSNHAYNVASAISNSQLLEVFVFLTNMA